LARRTMLVTWSLLIGTGAFLVSLDGCGGAEDPPQKVQHVVIIFQENRTPDNLFHSLPNADIADSGVNSHGKTIYLAPFPLAAGYDLDHSHAAV
jgi:phospholipase C